MTFFVTSKCQQLIYYILVRNYRTILHITFVTIYLSFIMVGVPVPHNRYTPSQNVNVMYYSEYIYYRKESRSFKWYSIKSNSKSNLCAKKQCIIFVMLKKIWMTANWNAEVSLVVYIIRNRIIQVRDKEFLCVISESSFILSHIISYQLLNIFSYLLAFLVFFVFHPSRLSYHYLSPRVVVVDQ